MQRIIVLFFIMFVLGCISQADTSLNGELKLDERVYSADPGSINYNRATLLLKTRSDISGQVSGYGELKVRTQDRPAVSSPSDLTSKSTVTPISIELKEAYVDVYAFPLANTDLRAGKQRIAWGTADRLNQTDNLNPYDFSDLLEFGEKIPTNAVKITSYLADNTLTLAFLPVFTPAEMPDNFNDSLTAYVVSALPPGFTLASSESRVGLPASKMENSMYAARLSRNIAGLDLSVSYFSGRDSIPNLENLTLTAVSTTQVNSVLTLDYSKVQVVGFDLAGTVGEVGYWAEIAAFQPDNVTQTVVSPLGTATTETASYTKYTVGFDYTLPADIYLNAQFMHGFFDERGSDLSDYVLTRLEKKLFDDKVKLAFTWLGEYGSGLAGNLFGPAVVFYPADSTEVQIGSFSIDGETGSKLFSMKDLDQVYFRAKYSF